LEKSLLAATEIGDKFIMAVCEFHYGYYSIFKGALKSSIEHLQNAIAYWGKAESTWALSWTHSFLGYAYDLFGDLDSARKHAEIGLSLESSIKFKAFSCAQYWILSEILLDTGKRGVIGKAAAIDVFDGGTLLTQALLDLRTGAMDEHEFHAEAVQQRDIMNQVGKRFVSHDLTTKGDDKHAVAKGMDVRR